jgi:RNA polymerase sigma factor (sigma-70 family)
MTQVLDFDRLAQVTAARAAFHADLTGALEREDLLQEARLLILELERRHDADRAPLSAWLVASLPWTLHRSIRRATPWKRSDRVQVHSVPHDELPERSESPMPAWDAAIDVQAILQQLSPEHRSVLWWHFAEGQSCPEIGRTLGLSDSEAENIVKRAMRAARAIAAGRSAPDDDADTARLLDALQAGADARGRLPGRRWVCERTGLSELRYARLMRRLVSEGMIIGRGPKSSGWLADDERRAA